jgi:ankyrin repeat protein
VSRERGEQTMRQSAVRHRLGRLVLLLPLLGGWLFLFSWSARAETRDLRLVEALKRNDPRTARALIEQGVDVNTAQGDGATALHWAAHWDDLAIVDLLVRRGANVNAEEDAGVTPLVLACLNGSARMVERLLQAGARPNAGTERAVMVAAKTGSADVMRLLLAHGGDANSKEPDRSQTALMWAASEKHPDVVQVLLQGGADVWARTKANQPSRDMRTATPAAPRPGQAQDQAAGQSQGQGSRRPPSNGANGFTPLLFAVRVGDLDSARLLLDAGADANDTADDGMSALVLSAVRGHPAVATLLLDYGADPDADEAGYTALHWAAGSWETELTVTAITTDREGEWATVAGLTGKDRLALVNSLLAHGANPNARMKKTPARAGSSKNPALAELEGSTPFLLAAAAGASDVMRALVAGKADVRLTTKGNGTALMAAAGLGRVQGEVLVPEKDTLAAAELIAQLGAADVNAVDDIGNTALHYAAYTRRDSIVRFLAERGASLEIKNKFGETPLWVAEVVIQFAGGGTYQIVPSSTGDLLRKLGAQPVRPDYGELRPRYWPDLPHT